MTVVVLVGFIVGGGVWWLFFRGPSDEQCAPVRELLSFNKTQIEALNAKTHYPEPGSYEQASEPSELDYHFWADGLTDRALWVKDPELAQEAQQLAETAQRLVRAKLDYIDQAEHTAPGAEAPPAAMAVAAFNDEFEARVGQLAAKCSE